MNSLWDLSACVLLFCKQIISTPLISGVKFSFPLYSFEFGEKCRFYLIEKERYWLRSSGGEGATVHVLLSTVT